MKTLRLCLTTAFFLALASPSSTQALPVDLSIPPSVFGPTSDLGYGTHWVEMAELDFGQGLALPVRLGFLSGRSETSTLFGQMPWRAPLLSSRIYDRTAKSWKVLLPCGRVMTLVPSSAKPGEWATPDGEWFVTPKEKHTLVSRLDGWEMEFNHQDYLVRLRTDSGRQVVWNRDPGGSLLTVAELPSDPKKPAITGFTVRRDPTSRLISSFTYRTAQGQKVYSLSFDAGKRLSAVTFPDKTGHQISYTTTPEGHPSMKIIGRDLIPTTLTWHKENRTLLSDGIWSYTITPQPGNNPLMTRTGPHGEVESQHDDSVNARELFTSAEGTQTLKQKVKSGPAKGKIEKISRILHANQESILRSMTAKDEPGTKNQEQVLYSATYNPQGLLESETDALGRTTTHTYTLHGTTIHTGIKTHTRVLQAFQPASEPPAPPITTTQEFDRHGNLTATTDALGHTIRHEYDSQNSRIKTTGPDGTVLETLTYTPQGRIATRTDALGATTHYGYDKDGNRTSTTDALGHITQDEYNALGLRIKSTDPLGRVTTFDYDKGGRLIQQTVAHGTPIAATTLYTYDEQGRRLTSTDSAGHTTTQTYDKLGRLTSRTDPLGHTTRYEYDVKRGSTGCISCSASGLPTRIISPSGRITERRYDADRHLIEETTGLMETAPGSTLRSPPSALSSVTTHSYDLAGNLLTTTDPLGRKTVHDYNALNKRIKTTHPDGSSKTFAYNALGQLTAETDELGHTTKRDYDPYGNLIALTTPEGHTTRTLFGESDAGTPARNVPAPNAAPTKNDEPGTKNSGHAALHRPTAIITPSGEKTTFTYDLLGRKTAVTKGAGSKLAATTTHTFDAVGNEISSSQPSSTTVNNSRPPSTRHEYDARNRRIRTLDALNRAWTFAYDTDSGPSGPAPCCGADPTSNTRAAKTIHPDGSIEVRITDAAGRLIETRDANATQDSALRTPNSAIRGVQYGYDPDGRLTTLTDAKGSVTTWRYDNLGKLAAKTYPDKTTELYEHDLAGQMTRRIRPDGTAASYTYNERGRLLKIDWSDDKTEDSTFAYDAAGHMTLAQNRSATLRRTYHPSGKLEKEVQELHPDFLTPVNPAHLENPVKNEVGYEYTPEGRLARLTYPNANTVSYEYNARGELARVIDSQSSILNSPSSIFTYQRREDGKITQIDLPNGAKTTKTYDEVGRLKTIAHLDKDGKVLESETSRYDLRNRRTARTKADGSTDLFRYDPAGQVTAAAYGQSGAAVSAASSTGAAANSPEQGTKNEEPGTKNFTPSQTFSYDPAGNRLEVTDNGMTTKYQPNAANQYEQIVTGTEIVEPQFDPLGNLLQDDRNTYTWDADIHLLSVTTKAATAPGLEKPSSTTVNNSKPSSTASFRYDPLHRRIARLENNTQLTLFVMDGWNVIQEHQANLKLETSDLKLSASHTWGEDLSGTLQGAGGIGGLLSSVHQPSTIVNNSKQSSTVPLWFHYDSNGNVILLTDTTAQASSRYTYDAFGQTMTATGITAPLNRYRFSTKPVEIGNGLAYYGYRYYDPVSGRWSSRDPVREKGGINLYSMSLNSAPNVIDVKGQLPVLPIILGGIACERIYRLYACSQANDLTCVTVCGEGKVKTSEQLYASVFPFGEVPCGFKCECDESTDPEPEEPLPILPDDNPQDPLP